MFLNDDLFEEVDNMFSELGKNCVNQTIQWMSDQIKVLDIRFSSIVKNATDSTWDELSQILDKTNIKVSA